MTMVLQRSEQGEMTAWSAARERRHTARRMAGVNGRNPNTKSMDEIQILCDMLQGQACIAYWPMRPVHVIARLAGMDAGERKWRCLGLDREMREMKLLGTSDFHRKINTYSKMVDKDRRKRVHVEKSRELDFHA
jgi:hypothetical protein